MGKEQQKVLPHTTYRSSRPRNHCLGELRGLLAFTVCKPFTIDEVTIDKRLIDKHRQGRTIREMPWSPSIANMLIVLAKDHKVTPD